jgi:hypothetical protein
MAALHRQAHQPGQSLIFQAARLAHGRWCREECRALRLDRASGRGIFLPYLQHTDTIGDYITLAVRTKGDPVALAPVVENGIWQIDRNVTISEVQTMTAVVERANAEPSEDSPTTCKNALQTVASKHSMNGFQIRAPSHDEFITCKYSDFGHSSTRLRNFIQRRIFPQPPGIGRKISGASSTNAACCSSVSIKISVAALLATRAKANFLPHTKSRQSRVKVLFHAFQAQGNPAKICYGHVAISSERVSYLTINDGMCLPLGRITGNLEGCFRITEDTICSTPWKLRDFAAYTCSLR